MTKLRDAADRSGPNGPGGPTAARRFNIAEACLGRWAARRPDRAALLFVDPLGRLDVWSWGRLRSETARLAAVLAAGGVGRGDRVAVFLPQQPETAAAHLAAYALGAVAVPLFAPFGPDAAGQRMRDCAAKAAVTDPAGAATLAEAGAAPALTLCVGGDAAGAADYRRALDRARDVWAPVDTAAEDPAFLAYTSGTTGAPKGALHPHRTLLGHLPAIQLWTGGLGETGAGALGGEVFWTPSDWAWLGGLCNLLLPSLYYGAPVLSAPMKPFDPERAADLLDRFGVTRAFLPPTALRLMRAAGVRSRAGGRLRALGAAGEPVGAALDDWARAALGVSVSEFYGQTECNGVVGRGPADAAATPRGALGRAIPGFRIAVETDAGAVAEADAEGELLVAAPNPSLMLGYWGRPDATAERVRSGWLRTGDRARIDADGVVWFRGRADDVINSAGYRIGPAEIEDCLCLHPAVAAAGAVAAPDPLRGEAVAAFVVLRPGAGAGTEPLADALRAHVKARLGGYASPRRIAFVEELPVTDTGKIVRRALRARAAGRP